MAYRLKAFRSSVGAIGYTPSMSATAPPPAQSQAVISGLTRAQLHELYYWMRLTRSLEERLVNLYRQTKVIGGLFRSLGQEADAVGQRLCARPQQGRHPLPPDPQPRLDAGAGRHPARSPAAVHGQGPESHPRPRAEHPFQRSRAAASSARSPIWATWSRSWRVSRLQFKMRKQPRVGLVYVGDGAMSTGAFHEGINFAAVQRLPLVVVIARTTAMPTRTPMPTADRGEAAWPIKAPAYGIPGVRRTATTCWGLPGDPDGGGPRPGRRGRHA